MADALGLQRCVSGTQLRDDFGHGLAADVLRSGGKAQIGGGLVAQQCARGNALRRQARQGRSEEHTSELQSPCNLVCRLLLEKKNIYYIINITLAIFIKEPNTIYFTIMYLS